MKLVESKRRKKVLWTSGIYIALIVLSIVLVGIRGISGLKPVYLINISVDIFGMITGYVLFVCCIIDVQKTGSNLKYFLYLLNVVYFGLFTDACAWMVNLNPSLRILNILDNTVYYMCGPIAACFFWLYTMTYLKLDKKIIGLLGKVVQGGLIVSLALIVINAFAGFYFTVDAQGVYQRSSFYLVSTIYGLFVMISAITAVYLERKQLENYQAVTLYIYALAPIILSVLTATVYGLSISYGVIMVIMLLMYCLLNVSQGREKAAADRDLRVAAGIQKHILPNTFPYLPERTEFDLHASMNAAKQVGGDFYDFFMTDDDHLALVIADVSGKGLPAGLFMMMARTLIRNRALFSSDNDPGAILHDVNNFLCEGNDIGLFVTAWLGILTLSDGRMVYANAGHEYPAICKNGGIFEVLKERHSPPLAAVEDMNFSGGVIEMERGDTVYVYTDGVTEAMDENEKFFDMKGMLESLNRDPSRTPKELDEAVRADISSFAGEAAQFDDITMLCIRYYGKEQDKAQQVKEGTDET
jgi:serine phosphatase RsbU (regulator of sigma subunit)